MDQPSWSQGERRGSPLKSYGKADLLLQHPHYVSWWHNSEDCWRSDSDPHHLYAHACGCSKIKEQIHDWSWLFGWKSNVWSWAIPPSPQPQVRAPTGQGLRVLDLWAPHVLRGHWGGTELGREEIFGVSNKLVYSISAHNLAHDLQNRSTHQIRTYIPPLETRKMQWCRRMKQTLFSSTHLAVGSQIILFPAQVLASQDKSMFMLLKLFPSPSHQHCSPQTWARSYLTASLW